MTFIVPDEYFSEEEVFAYTFVYMMTQGITASLFLNNKNAVLKSADEAENVSKRKMYARYIGDDLRQILIEREGFRKFLPSEGPDPWPNFY